MRFILFGMRVLYLDCFSGISGDMMIGALADLGVMPSTFEWELSKMELGDFHLHFERQVRQGIAGIKFDVHSGSTHVEEAPDRPEEGRHPKSSSEPTDDFDLRKHHHHLHDPDGHSLERTHDNGPKVRNFSVIRDLIRQSELSDFVKTHAVSIFTRIGEAEAKIHGQSLDEIYFHEIGSLDSIVDIVLTTVGIEILGIERLYFSRLCDGQGTFVCSHGQYPLPAPATLEILKGIPISQIPVECELVTPSGAAIVAEFQHAVGLLPSMRAEKIGYGVGQRHLPNRPNVLRAVIGQLEPDPAREQIVELQANIDDLSPEILGAAQERLFRAGALDVFLVPVQMKKNRPGMMITVLCRRQDRETMLDILFAETSTFGVRYQEMDRVSLERETVQVDTTAGPIQIKVGRRHGRIVQASPEFESCDRVARASQQPLKRIYEIALRAFWSEFDVTTRNSAAPP